MEASSPAASMTTSGSCAAVDGAQGGGGVDAGVVDGVRRAVALAVSQAVGFEIEGDDLGGVAALQREVEPESRRALADDGDGLAAQIGQECLAAKSTGAELLRLDGMLERRARRDWQQAVDGRAVVFLHGAMVRRQAEHAVARLDCAAVAIKCRVNGFDDADHFVARFADGRGIAVVGQVVDMADVAAAEGEAQGLDDGCARLQGRLGRVNELAMAAGDDLDGFSWAGFSGWRLTEWRAV